MSSQFECALIRVIGPVRSVSSKRAGDPQRREAATGGCTATEQATDDRASASLVALPPTRVMRRRHTFCRPSPSCRRRLRVTLAWPPPCRGGRREVRLPVTPTRTTATVRERSWRRLRRRGGDDDTPTRARGAQTRRSCRPSAACPPHITSRTAVRWSLVSAARSEGVCRAHGGEEGEANAAAGRRHTAHARRRRRHAHSTQTTISDHE